MQRVQLSPPSSFAPRPAVRLSAVPFMAMPFLRRTAVWAAATALLVASAALRIEQAGPAWSWRYLQAAAWASVFFALTPLIVKHLVFNGNKGLGFALLIGKLAWMGLMLVLLFAWQGEDAGQMSKVSALLGGILTPLAVLGLRVAGFYLEYARKTAAGRAATMQTSEASR